MKTFNDEWSDDMSEFKKLSFEEVAKGLQENRLANTLNFLNRFEKKAEDKTEFPTFPSGQRREWRTYYGYELADAFFGGEQSRTGGPGDEVKIYDETGMFEGPNMSGTLYLDNNYNKKFDGKDELLFDIKVYISYDGAKLLRAWRTVETTVKDNEVLIFLENNKDDVNSGTVMMVRAGKKAKKKLGKYAGSDRINEFINKRYKISKENQEGLLRSALNANIFMRALGVVINTVARVIAWPVDKLGDFFEWIGDKIEGLAIGESAYLGKTETSEKLKEHQEKMAELFKNIFQDWSDPPEELPTTMNDYESLLHQLWNEAIAFVLDHDAEEVLRMFWAAICGIINGIIDFIAGIFKFIGLLLHLLAKLIRAGGDVLANIGYYQLLIAEYQDNFTQALQKIDWKEIIADAMTAISNIDFKKMLVGAGAAIIKTDERKLAYYGGYIAVNVILLIIPIADVVQFVRIGKFIAEFPLIEKLLSKLGSLISKTRKTASSELEKLLIYFEDIVDTFKQGTRKVSEIIQELINEFRIWLEELVGLKRGESLIDKTVRTLQETLSEVVVKARVLRGHIATEIKDWLVRRYKMTRAVLELLEELGVTITRNAKNMAKRGRALATPEGFIVKYGGEEIFEGTGDAIRKFSKKIEDIKNSKGKNAASQLLRDRKAIAEYVKARKAWKMLDKDSLLAKFKNAFTVKHFDAVAYYEKMISKYPRLKGFINEGGQVEQKNIAEFGILKKTKDGKFENVKEVYHSGKGERLYENDFTHPFEEGDSLTSTFQKRVTDLNGKPRRNDSEVKFIFNFILKHLHTADEFVIETRNIYYACTSCQRELLMFKEFVESMGKKIEIVIYGDEEINGGINLFELLNK